MSSPAATVWGVDINRRAVALLEENGRRYGLRNLRAVTPEEVPSGLRFDAIYSNPPVKIGKQRMRTLLREWLERLQPSGHAYPVVKRNLGVDGLAAWLTDQGLPTERLRSKQGYRVLDVVRPATPDRSPGNREAPSRPQAPSP